MTLLLSLLALLIGPGIYYLVGKRRSLLDLIDGFVFLSVGGLVLMHLTPALASERPFLQVLFACAGFLGPNFFEQIFHRAESKIHLAALIIGILGLIIHTAIDGAALVVIGGGGGQVSSILPVAIIIHRIPVGLALWWLMRPRFNRGICWFALFGMCAATLLGYSLGEGWYTSAHQGWFVLIQAFVAGSILHVVFFRVHFDDGSEEGGSCCSHKHSHSHAPKSELVGIGKGASQEKKSFKTLVNSWPEAIGNLLGIVVLTALIVLHETASSGDHIHGHHGHDHSVAGFEDIFLSLALQTAPALLIAYVAAVFLFGFLPSGTLKWLAAGSRLKQAFKGVAVGLPLPVCSCGILPFYRTIVEKGAPPAAAIAFLIATPELGLDALLISFPLLGADFTLVRLAAAFVLALTAGWFLSRFVHQDSEIQNLNEDKLTIAERLRGGARYGLIELVDMTGPWILFGLALAAVADPLMSSIPLNLPGQLEIILFALVGVVVYVCAAGATPLVAVFLAQGVSPGAALVFILTGPATNISTFGILSELHGKRFGFLFGITTASIAIALGYLLNIFQSSIALQSSEQLLHDHASPIQYVCLVLLTLLFLSSMLRKGARGFLSGVFGHDIA
jgi:uncharacterized membrane protein YraQ (UPF0718 family)